MLSHLISVFLYWLNYNFIQFLDKFLFQKIKIGHSHNISTLKSFRIKAAQDKIMKQFSSFLYALLHFLSLSPSSVSSPSSFLPLCPLLCLYISPRSPGQNTIRSSHLSLLRNVASQGSVLSLYVPLLWTSLWPLVCGICWLPAGWILISAFGFLIKARSRRLSQMW